jgi:hypothetical protein
LEIAKLLKMRRRVDSVWDSWSSWAIQKGKVIWEPSEISQEFESPLDFWLVVASLKAF